MEVQLRTFIVKKETPKGYWLYPDNCGRERWVSKTSKKRYAYPTKEEAFESLGIRKQRQLEHCEQNLEKAKAELLAVQNFIQENI